MVPGPWYQDLGTKILVPKKTESLRGGASQKLSEGARGAAGPPSGGLGGWKPPRNSRGFGGRQPPSKDNFSAQGPSPAQARFWKSGNLEIQKFGVQKMEKIKILKIQIRSAPNVGKVWISKTKLSWPHVGPFQVNFSMDRKNTKKIYNFCLFPLVVQWLLFTLFGALAAIHPWWGCMYNVVR